MSKELYQSDIQVVLVEDDLMVQEVNRLFVDKINGFKIVGVAKNGKEGRKLIRELNPDLVLLDIFMPQEDGLMTISKLREEEEDVDIIAITAANDAETIKKLLRMGTIDYIVKPFTFERLKQALIKYQNMYQQLKTNEQFSQITLDRVTNYEKNGNDVEKVDLPKGLHEKTLNQIIISLKKISDERSAEEIAEDVGLARVTVRRYLQYLEEISSVEMNMNYGTIGRPIQHYRWIDGGGDMK